VIAAVASAAGASSDPAAGQDDFRHSQTIAMHLRAQTRPQSAPQPWMPTSSRQSAFVRTTFLLYMELAFWAMTAALWAVLLDCWRWGFGVFHLGVGGEECVLTGSAMSLPRVGRYFPFAGGAGPFRILEPQVRFFGTTAIPIIPPIGQPGCRPSRVASARDKKSDDR